MKTETISSESKRFMAFTHWKNKKYPDTVSEAIVIEYLSMCERYLRRSPAYLYCKDKSMAILLCAAELSVRYGYGLLPEKYGHYRAYHVECPYCKKEAKLFSGMELYPDADLHIQDGYEYRCPICGASVKAYDNTAVPVGPMVKNNPESKIIEEEKEAHIPEVKQSREEKEIPDPAADLRKEEHMQTQNGCQQLSLFPEESSPEVQFAVENKITQKEIDHILRIGGNREHHREYITLMFEKGKGTEYVAECLPHFYQGGNGIVTSHGHLSAWYHGDGIHLVQGDYARYHKADIFISWDQAAKRIEHLLDSGQFAVKSELENLSGFERKILAESLWRLNQDLRRDAHEKGLLSKIQQIYTKETYSNAVQKISDSLKDPEWLRQFIQEYSAFMNAYNGDYSILRFRKIHDIHKIEEDLQELTLERKAYFSNMEALPVIEKFITQDEVNATLSRGSGYSGGASRINSFFQKEKDIHRKIVFLKNEYGIGGSSHAVSGEGGSGIGYEGKGITLMKKDCPTLTLDWKWIASRISALVEENRYYSEK